MAFSTTITHVILFIGAVIAAYLIASTLTSSIQDVSNSIAIQNDLMSEKLKTVLNIDSVYVNSTNIIIYLKNIGYTALPVNKTSYDVYIDGIMQNITEVNLIRDENYNGVFDPGDVLAITLDNNLASGIHKVKVVTNNGAYVEDEFST